MLLVEKRNWKIYVTMRMQVALIYKFINIILFIKNMKIKINIAPNIISVARDFSKNNFLIDKI